MSGVSLRNLRKAFGAVHALDDVSLDAEPGELIALLGPSGCGKTTLLRCVAGLEQPDDGEIAIGGQNVTAAPARKRPIGMVFQSYVLFPNMTIRQNIGFPLKVRGATSQALRKRTDELLTLVGLTDEAERYPHQVSGGQQQRGALARALAPEPAVLLLDEPLSALDALVRTRLRDEIRRIQQMIKITALYVTHDQSEAMAIADRVAVMNQGKIEQLARPPELYDGPATRFSAGFVGNRNVIELLVEQGEVALGQAFRAPAPPGSGRAIAFFRPEDVRLSSNGGQEATVESVMFGGMLTRIYLTMATESDAARLYADLPSRQALDLRPGTTVRIAIDPADVRVFPAE
jgi:putative spermidine/putrescine transport system ATP-binding protein